MSIAQWQTAGQARLPRVYWLVTTKQLVANAARLRTAEAPRSSQPACDIAQVQLEFTVPVEVLDESYSGIALSLDRRQLLAPGDQVTVYYAGAPMRAEVRHVTPQTDGRDRVGLSWK